jgi:hypothetical protein
MGRQQRRGLRLVTTALALVASGEASAEKVEWNDVPRTMVRTAGAMFNRLNVQCTRVDQAPREAECEISQVTIEQPDAQRIAQEISEIEQSFQKKSEANKYLRELCRSVSSAEGLQPHEQAFVDKVTAACKAKDAEALKQALVWQAQEVRGQTCRLMLWHPEHRRFKQVDKNTWTHHQQSAGSCGVSLVVTLWRAPGATGPFWNYKQVRVAPPNSADEFCRNIKDSTTEWRWDSPSTRPLECRYLDH